MKKTNRILSLLLALCLCMALLPATALAAGEFSIDSKNVLTKYNGPGGDVTIPYGVTGIGDRAFYERSDVTSVIIPDTVTNIGRYAFEKCTGLSAINIPDSVTKIDSEAFRYCTSLTSAVIPDSVTEIGMDIFADCTSLTSAVVGSGVRTQFSWGINGTFCNCTNLTDVTIKNGLNLIPEEMFSNCTSLTSIVIPDSVTKIYNRAFYGCSSLTNVDLGKNVGEINYGAFGLCPKLKHITLPVNTWFDGAFKDFALSSSDSTQIESLTLAEGTKTVLSSAWYGSVPSVTKIFVPSSVTAVQDGSFDALPNLTVYSTKGGFMESYCALRGIPFVANSFEDVSFSAYYAEPVFWAVENNITAGTSANSFSPDKTCSVAEILTFLYRAKGSPTVSIENPFSDVSSRDYYYDAARWAYEQHLVSGSQFNGGTPCTRSMVVTYLWTLAGSPNASGAQFSDVPASSSYAKAVSWAVIKGVTSGTGDGKFSPDATCTRGQIVTFLYRTYK